MFTFFRRFPFFINIYGEDTECQPEGATEGRHHCSYEPGFQDERLALNFTKLLTCYSKHKQT